MTTNVAIRKSDLVSQYMDATGQFLQSLNKLKGLKVTYDSLPAFADADFTTSFSWLDASTFSTGVGNLDTLITTLASGGSVAPGTRNTIEAMVPVVPR